MAPAGAARRATCSICCRRAETCFAGASGVDTEGMTKTGPDMLLIGGSAVAPVFVAMLPAMLPLALGRAFCGGARERLGETGRFMAAMWCNCD